MDKDVRLMYKPPNSDKYIQVAEALDELYHKVMEIEAKLNSMGNNQCQDNPP